MPPNMLLKEQLRLILSFGTLFPKVDFEWGHISFLFPSFELMIF